jgi:hypothetical protein
VSYSKRFSQAVVRWNGARGPITLLVVAGVLFGGASHKITDSFSSDVALYDHYANAALASPLLHSMPREYPALALAIFLAPLAVPVPYALGFSLLAALAGIVLVLSSDGLAEYPGWSRRTCYYLLIGTAAVVFGRYDVFPVLAMVLAVEGARQEKWGRAWAWAVLGGLLKLFPLLLLPGFLLVERAQTGKWALRRIAAAFVTVTVLTIAQLALSAKSVLSPLRYQLDRGFELSSLQGSVTFLLDPLHIHWVAGFGSIEVIGPGKVTISILVALVMVTALFFVWLFAARGQLPVVAVSLAALSVAVLSDKSFAPQYLIWLAPLWAYWPIRRGWVVAALLTTLVYPLLYVEANSWGPGFYLPTAVAMARNVVLLVATTLWLLEQLRLNRATRSAPVGEIRSPTPPKAVATVAPSGHVAS